MIEVHCAFSEDVHSNTYLLVDDESREAAIVDPSHMPSVFDVDLLDYKLKYVLLTHGHFDHIFKIDKYRRSYGALVCVHSEDAILLQDGEKNASALFMREPFVTDPADVTLTDGQSIYLGRSEIKVMHTPGHTPGSVCYITENNIFSGDTLFAGSIGRTDFWGGSFVIIKESLQKLKSLKKNYNVFSGHGPQTTLDREKKYNNYLLYMHVD